MTIKEFQISLTDRIKNLKTFTEPLKIGALSATTLMGERIFDEGKKTDGSSIGQYSTKPIYVNPQTLRDINVPSNIGVPRGKHGDTKFKTGKKKGEPHKTKYLEGGYKELREKTRRKVIDYVNLTFGRELRMDFGNSETDFVPEKVSDFEYQIKLDKEINVKKRSGLEEKYGTIFTISEPEKEEFFRVVGFEFRNRING